MKTAAKPTRVRPPAGRPAAAHGARIPPADLPSALAALEARADAKTLAGMARYGLPSTDALGVAVGDIQSVAKLLGHDHALAAELWQTGVFEARMLAAYVDEPERGHRRADGSLGA